MAVSKTINADETLHSVIISLKAGLSAESILAKVEGLVEWDKKYVAKQKYAKSLATRRANQEKKQSELKRAAAAKLTPEEREAYKLTDDGELTKEGKAALNRYSYDYRWR